MLASSSEDDTVRVWKVPAGGSLAVLEHAANVDAIAPPRRRAAASASGSVIRVKRQRPDDYGRVERTRRHDHRSGVQPDRAARSVGAGLNDDNDPSVERGRREIRALEPDDRVSVVAFSLTGARWQAPARRMSGCGRPQAADVMVADPGLATFVTPTVAVVQDAPILARWAARWRRRSSRIRVAARASAC